METGAESTADDVELSAYCPAFQAAVEIIGRRWSGAVIRAVLAGRRRFNDVAAAIPGISDRLLSERLKELETAGILHREVIPEIPVRVEYTVTPKGEGLIAVFQALDEWTARWADPS